MQYDPYVRTHYGQTFENGFIRSTLSKIRPKYGKGRAFCSGDILTDRQTDTQTYRFITILRNRSRGRSNKTNHLGRESFKFERWPIVGTAIEHNLYMQVFSSQQTC